MENILLSNSEIERMNIVEKREYYLNLQNYCLNQNFNTYSNKLFKKVIYHLSPFIRNYDLEIYGEENIPQDDSAVFISNHSNSHDFFSIIEVFENIGKSVTPFGASDCLNFATKLLFMLGDVTLIDRGNKESSFNGMLHFSKKIIEGKCGLILGEGTWNLHPILPMQPIKIGGTKVAAITNKVIIPTIFEYVEVNDICEREKELYKKCIVIFGKSITVQPEDNIISKTKEVQVIMENMRRDLWGKIGINKRSLEDINKNVYLNHTYLKKFGAFGFEFDSEHEFQYLLRNNNNLIDNEYCLNQNGDLVPGITKKDRSSLPSYYC